jgi:hypothetical protein
MELNLRMIRAATFTLLVVCFLPFAAKAQAQPERAGFNPEEILAASQQHLHKGEACLKDGNFECARREFDQAIDSIFDSGVDVRGDERLRAGLRELIEKINRYETSSIATSAAGGWKTQEFDGRPVEDRADVAEANEFAAPTGPLTSADFQRRFNELRKNFRNKYGRDMTLTGADHGEHTRLYGRGSAYDIRVRDLNREQVSFIIDAGNKLGLRIKDFSTWGKVAAHNARSLSLGRPLDTFATGIHLHIDRMTPFINRRMVESPAVSKRQRNTGQPKTN